MTTGIRRSGGGVAAGVRAPGWLAITALLALLTPGGAARGGDRESDRDFCERTSRNMLKACRYEARGDYHVALARCENLGSASERKACQRQAAADLREAFELCGDQLDARDDVCDGVGDGPYNPEIRPENFVTGVKNPFFPLVPGTTFIFEGETDEGHEHGEFVVTHKTRKILGVTCIVVHDTAEVDGELVEDTLDFFAEDKDGNVWYFGEATKQIENDEIVGIEGSWEAGVDGARPGIVMKAQPKVGEVYRQEFFLGDAEDVAEVLSLKESASVPAGSFTKCLKTRDFTPIEPDANEHKIYAPGIGLVLTIDVAGGGARTELVQIRKE